MENLPVELCRTILSFVDIPSLKNFRLTSRFWGGLGEDYLISPTFFSLSYRNDIHRLTTLAKNPRFRLKIETLSFLHGEVNEYHARHNTYFLNYMQDPDIRMDMQTSVWSTYADLRAQKERYLPTACDKDALMEILSLLPNLKTVEVSLMTCPFQEDEHPEMLKEIWGIPSTRLMPRVATTERFTNLVSALASNITIASIKSLSHDRLPFEFFAQRPATIHHMSGAFRSLTSLSLAIDYSDMPNNLHQTQAFHNLSLCMRSASQLQTLALQFMGRRKIDIRELLFTFRVSDYEFRHLETIALRGITSTAADLGTFLVKQKSLKSIQLGGLGLKTRHQPPNGGVHLSEGSFKGLFERVRRNLNLESLKVQGDLVGQQSGERWVLENVEDEKDLWEFVMD
ncbi:uncharacterized protein LY89DRAFT_700775 [Mollisia scopiformis]|uniref:F-box domain-containing protein n=1 Tax=Mollisia scopiformis TaxID=149040 RepID=A0A132BCZ7_MOLSC|nr:uncharacterized protein LY89DRAFT_700775 [Mollisia scopiformis]KUJ10241.1 hypothetical protein LY89DRAFT_700775 [Mollisia scopiformis]